MEYRPIDIAKKLNISTSTLRVYEDMEIIPPVNRTDSGYRVYTEVHLQYFICIRKMVNGYTLSFIKELLTEYMRGNLDKSLWMITKSQADLYSEKIRLEKVSILLKKYISTENIHRKVNLKKLITIKEMSEITNISSNTIRYWEDIGLLNSTRGINNNYRFFSESEVRKALVIHALKYSLKLKYNFYHMKLLKKEYENFICNESNINNLVESIKLYLDKLNSEMIQAIVAFQELLNKGIIPS